MKSPSVPPAKPVLSLAKYAEAQADLAKWSMLAAAPLRSATGTAATGLSQKRACSRRRRRNFAAVADVLEKALMKRNGNRLSNELKAKLAQISKMAAARRDKHSAWSRICGAIGLAKRRG